MRACHNSFVPAGLDLVWDDDPALKGWAISEKQLRRALPRFRAQFQTVEKLTEIEAVELDGAALSHNSTELPGQVRERWQAIKN